MLRRCSLLPAILLVALAAAPLHAQTASVSVPAWVDGNPCSDAPDFKATLNGKPATITAKFPPGSDQVILLVLDLTSSLSSVAAAKEAAIAAISKLPPNAWVGLLRAQDGLHVLTDPGPNRQALIAAIQSLSTNGEPGLLETVDSALSLADEMLRQTSVRVSVLYLTDGSIYAYREDYTNPVINPSDPYDLSRRIPGALVENKISSLVRSLRSDEAPLFVVQLILRQDSLNEGYQNGLQTLAQATGGKAEICRSDAEIPDAISSMFARISSSWRLTLTVPPNVHDDLHIRLSVPCSDGDARVSWRTDYYQKGRK
jgi:VWA domain-containing protein